MEGGRQATALLEREAALGLLAGQLTAAAEGAGSVVLVEGPPGVGKTALLRALREQAGARGLRTLQAVGGELEREFAFGIVRQLFEPVVVAADPAERERLLTGAAARVAPLVGGDPDAAGAFEPSADAGFATLHGLYWLAAALAEQAPLLLVVDDAHWADAPSLRFLDFLARRLPELPLLLAVGMRPSEPGADAALLAALAEGPEVATVRPRPLSADGVRAIVAATLGLGDEDDGDDDLAARAFAATGGNPLLVRELTRSLAAGEEAPSAAALDGAPASVVRLVQRRLARLPEAAATLARVLAALGERRDAALLAGVSGLAADEVERAVATLRAADLVEGDPPAFVHPLVRQAVAETVAAGERDRVHRRAAELLNARGDAGDEVVVHLLAAPPLGEPWVAPLLRDAAQRALGEGAPEAAVRRLRRALEEHGADADGAAALQLELGTAAMAAGDPLMVEALRRAAHGDDPLVAALATELQIPLGVFDEVDGLPQMIDRLRTAIARFEPDDPVLGDRLRGRLLDGLVMWTELGGERAGALAEPVAAPGPSLAAHLAWEAAAGDASAEEIRRLAAIALAPRPFTRLIGVEQPTALWAVMALTLADGADQIAPAMEDAEATLRRQSSTFGRGFASMLQSERLRAFGSAALAEAYARESVELLERTGNVPSAMTSRGSLVSALVLRGELEAAEAELALIGPDEQFEQIFGGGNVWSARGELRIAQGRPHEAVEAFERIRRLCDHYGWRRYPRGTVTADHARALALAGRREEAAALAEAEVADARRRGVRRLEAAALVALGLAREGGDGIDALRAAVELDGADGLPPAASGEPSTAPPAARATSGGSLAALELGAALRRSGQRAEARTWLAQARDLAHRCEATGLLSRATDELAIAGGRPRRIALSGAEALTPSERRVAEQAARGLTNREIAETLFVTRKTVESQLGAAYSKLGIRSRAQLAEALGGAREAAG